MTEEQIFKSRFPEYCVGEKCLSPYFDLFQIGFEEGENQSKQLQEENTKLKEQIEQMKCCENCKHYKPCLTVNDEIGNMCEDYYNGCNNSKYEPFSRWELKSQS